MSRILITGSNSGFGRLAALSLASAGHQVIATMRDPGRGAGLLSDCDAAGVEVEVRRLDVSDPASVAAALEDADTIDALVNNAGFEVQGALETIDDALMWRQLDTNVLGPLRTIRQVVPVWRARGSGVIVNVGSVVGIAAMPYGGAYAASKWALEGMSESLHFEVAPAGIRVHVIEPGRFPTTGFHDNIVRPEGWDGSVHQARALSLRQALTKLDTGEPRDAQLVADAIVRAVTDPSTPFRTVVGDDGELIAAAKRGLSFEEFEAAMRTTLDWHD